MNPYYVIPRNLSLVRSLNIDVGHRTNSFPGIASIGFDADNFVPLLLVQPRDALALVQAGFIPRRQEVQRSVDHISGGGDDVGVRGAVNVPFEIL